VDAGLAESIHYSIMFYGGRLLNHLTAEDDEVEKFISLRALNRNLVILMDSDKNKADDPVNKTKQRISAEFSKEQGFPWITAGRTIENYIDAALMASCIDQILAGGGAMMPKDDEFSDRLKKENYGGRPIEKVKLAHLITEKMPDLNILDLKSKVDELIKFIRKANQIE